MCILGPMNLKHLLLLVTSLTLISYNNGLGGSHGLVVTGRDSRTEGRGFESSHRISDGHFLHVIVVIIVMMFV